MILMRLRSEIESAGFCNSSLWTDNHIITNRNTEKEELVVVGLKHKLDALRDEAGI